MGTSSARPLRPFPRWTTIAAVGWAAAAVSPQLADVLLPSLLLPVIVAATWLEDAGFRWATRQGSCLRAAAILSAPALWPMTAGVAAALLEGFGDGWPVALAGVWMGSAALGSLVVWAVDGVARRVSSGFATWVRTTVLGVLVVAGAAFVGSAMVLPLGFSHLVQESLRVEVDGQQVQPDELPRELIEAGVPEFFVTASDPARTLGDLLGLVLLALLAPALWSAVSKLGERALDRIYPLDAAMERVATGDLEVRVEVGGTAEFARLASRFNEMVEALELARRMEAAFGAYVSRPVLDRIRAQHGAFELPIVQRNATVFFADIRGFTSMSERLPPERVLAVLRRFYREALEVVGAHEGYVDKFIGDAVYVVFNGPIEQSDHVARGVACALELQALVARLNDGGAFPEVGRLEIGIGVATGPVIAGNLGTERATQFAVVGDTVNLAARLSGLCPANEVWISPTTAEMLGDRLTTEPLEPVRPKGKQNPVTPFRVAGPARSGDRQPVGGSG